MWSCSHPGNRCAANCFDMRWLFAGSRAPQSSHQLNFVRKKQIPIQRFQQLWVQTVGRLLLRSFLCVHGASICAGSLRLISLWLIGNRTTADKQCSLVVLFFSCDESKRNQSCRLDPFCLCCVLVYFQSQQAIRAHEKMQFAVVILIDISISLLAMPWSRMSFVRSHTKAVRICFTTKSMLPCLEGPWHHQVHLVGALTFSEHMHHIRAFLGCTTVDRKTKTLFGMVWSGSHWMLCWYTVERGCNTRDIQGDSQTSTHNVDLRGLDVAQALKCWNWRRLFVFQVVGMTTCIWCTPAQSSQKCLHEALLCFQTTWSDSADIGCRGSLVPLHHSYRPRRLGLFMLSGVTNRKGNVQNVPHKTKLTEKRNNMVQTKVSEGAVFRSYGRSVCLPQTLFLPRLLII